MKFIGNMSVLSGEDFGQRPVTKGRATHAIAEVRTRIPENEGVRAERERETVPKEGEI